jgi:hemerythrin-like domain-containing protein
MVILVGRGCDCTGDCDCAISMCARGALYASPTRGVPGRNPDVLHGVSIRAALVRRLVRDPGTDESEDDMPNAPTLLNADGTASMATALLMSHHAFRRDIARFAAALRQVAGGDRARAEGLPGEWQSYRNALHGHHEAEDNGLFPNLVREHAELVPVIERLAADHRRIDPLLERGDRVFAALGADVAEAASVAAELSALLDEHLAVEEERVIDFIRGAKQFPPPATDAEADLYAEGFAWSSHGVAAEVLARVDEMLPPVLTSRLPAARARFEARWRRVWGPVPAGASRTAIPG